jgi:hypothetical protein
MVVFATRVYHLLDELRIYRATHLAHLLCLENAGCVPMALLNSVVHCQPQLYIFSEAELPLGSTVTHISKGLSKVMAAQTCAGGLGLGMFQLISDHGVI